LTRPRSLQLRLLVALGALSVAASALLMVAAWFFGRNAADRAYDHMLSASALAIAESVYVRNNALRVDLPYASLDMLDFARDERVFYAVLAPSGETVTGYGDLPAPPNGPVSGRKATFFDARYRDTTVRVVSIRQLVAEPELSGWATVRVAQTRVARDALARDMALGAAVPILLLLTIMLTLVAIAVRRGLTPLRELSAELARRPPTDLRPLATSGPREIAPLVEALNGFMERLEQSLEQLRRLIGDAAHQLRNPLASLQAQTELALEESDPERRTYLLRRIDSHARTTNRLTRQLLADAIIGHRGSLPVREPIDLAELVDQSVREAVPLADDSRERVLRRFAVTTAPIMGDSITLREALRNLVENALLHGGSQAFVEIALEPTDHGFIVSVTDDGPGIPKAEHPRVVQRFERGQNASTSGSGLGLAIAAAVARQHGSELVLDKPPRGGLRVSMAFARSEPS